MRHLKVKIIGDPKVGKTSLLSKWYQINYPSEDLPHQHGSLPPVMESFFVNLTVNCESFVVTYWDTCTMKSYYNMDIVKLKPLEYEDTDVCLACFDISNSSSFQHLSTVWVPEMKHYVPGIPVIVVGNKKDLRTSVPTTVDIRKGMELAQRLDAVYIETNAMTGEGLQKVMEAALRAACSKIDTSTEKKSKRKFTIFSPNEKVFSKKMEPPSLPGNVPEEIVISIPPSKYSSDMKKLLTWSTSNCSDLNVELPPDDLAVHKIVLCMASDWFRMVLLDKSITGKRFKDLLIRLRGDQEQQELTHKAFRRLIEYIYTFDYKACLCEDRLLIRELLEMARLSKLTELEECCKNTLNSQEHLNEGLCSVANDQRRQMTREYFVNKMFLADVTFSIENKHIYAHKAIIIARCDVMAAMLGGGFKEGIEKYETPMTETTEEAFLDLLDYLYTDSLNESQLKDYRHLLVLSDKFCLPRLRAICESFISNQIKAEIRKRLNLSSETCRLLIQTLLLAECHNALQLYNWCFYIITIYYSDFEGRDNLSLLNPQTRCQLENRRWPPLSYLKELEDYKEQTKR